MYGLGGKICEIGIPISQESDFKGFTMQMEEVEIELKRIVNRLSNQTFVSF